MTWHQNPEAFPYNPIDTDHNRELRRTHMARLKQGHLKDMEPSSIHEIDAAAEVYVGHRDRRMSALTKEREAQAVLMALMEKHKLKVYEYDGKAVVVIEETKVKVRKTKPGEDNGEEEEGEDAE